MSSRKKKEKDKGKAKASPSALPYKAAVSKTTDQLKAEARKAIPSDMRLRKDAYDASTNSEQANEFVYPFIPYSTAWIAVIEQKHAQLSAEEISSFYTREFADPFLYPKETNYYLAILISTGSVEIDSVVRSGSEWAYSKAFIKKILLPDYWNGDLFRYYEIPKTRGLAEKRWFNYFDYIKAWDGAFNYENKQRRHTWFLQFRGVETTNFPQWFIRWFYNWGFNPIILPDKIRKIYEDFEDANPSLKYHELIFAVHYKVPWIAKWEFIKHKSAVHRFGKLVTETPYLGRTISIKWWDKFEFFGENSVFSQKGLLSFEPPRPPAPPKKDVSEILEELLASTSKSDLKRQLKELLSEGEDDEEDGANSQGTDDIMQDSQYPE